MPEVVIVGVDWSEGTRAAQYAVDHVVVGRHGHSRVRSLLFGSTPGDLIQIATVPVTVVP